MDLYAFVQNHGLAICLVLLLIGLHIKLNNTGGINERR